MPLKKDNIFSDIPAEIPEELIQNIARCNHVRIERILSKGHRSAENFWYDQAWDEWVLLLQGAAALEVEGQVGVVKLSPGDHLLIRASVKHRVAWTAKNETTLWLAVHMYCPGEAPWQSDKKKIGNHVG